MEQVDCIVIGAGVIGLTIARALVLQGREVIVLERNSLIGAETSSHNSEVIHAGIYYPKDSLKAALCVRGKEMLYRFAAERGIAFERCGKLIVATTAAQIAELDGIAAKAVANGVADLRLVSKNELKELEPALHGEAALLSPSTGIIDSHGLMLAAQGDLEEHGGAIAFQTPVISLQLQADGFLVETGGPSPMTLAARTVINAAGHGAPLLAQATKGLAPAHQPTGWFAKGNYFTLSGRAPFSRLIYPVPQEAGLGVHLTLDLGGQARFGPDVEWVENVDYAVDPSRGESFYDAIRTYWPDLPEGALEPGYAGVRPKLGPAGSPTADFRIDGPETHGVPGLINLFGIESPGLTASLAIADLVASMATKRAD